ncbi:hypothetical protein AB6A40_010258 [Gnathostoma spinigerum]|uniref:Uncharacterized protein n=1 Tax=Gnathostoma spinigerum TaxID=75299 RepID=A0ABD6EU96_9BILA
MLRTCVLLPFCGSTIKNTTLRDAIYFKGLRPATVNRNARGGNRNYRQNSDGRGRDRDREEDYDRSSSRRKRATSDDHRSSSKKSRSRSNRYQ